MTKEYVLLGKMHDYRQCSCRFGSNYIVTCKYLVSTGYKQSKKGGKDQESQVKICKKS